MNKIQEAQELAIRLVNEDRQPQDIHNIVSKRMGVDITEFINSALAKRAKNLKTEFNASNRLWHD